MSYRTFYYDWRDEHKQRLDVYASPDSQGKSHFYHPYVPETDDFSVFDYEEQESQESKEDEIVSTVLRELNEAAHHLGAASKALNDSESLVMLHLKRAYQTTSDMYHQCDCAIMAVMIAQQIPALISFRTEYEQWCCIANLFEYVLRTLEVQPHWLNDMGFIDGEQSRIEFMQAYVEHERDKQREAFRRMREDMDRLLVKK